MRLGNKRRNVQEDGERHICYILAVRALLVPGLPQMAQGANRSG